ncbi:mercuric transport protein MerTP [Mucilaginibacter gossypii]|uniref:mercuric transport protein MerTP n=1 Tax=Mucilaginibacter gossypii TaxID=551996 RepID=UPI000DCF3CD1|nr:MULTISPECIES: mercuric transport protein MerTP [Mucilaginibacter]QTE35818.1 mercuric transport protein MerTP [Mucilaginibacter gossypii]RAV54624.1 mercuric transport protein MerTP [Mucilaginibacter rubeus]
MNNLKSSQTWLGAGVITAIGASLCCITPVLALISGASGIASSFSWMEPFRPYLIAITLGVLGFAWYQKLKPKTAEEIACACEDDEKPSFFQSKTFLSIITVFAIVMLAFPYYGQAFYPKENKNIVVVSADNIKQVNFKLRGMDCASCEEHIKYSVNKLPGILETKADYKTGIANVKYDQSKTNKNSIIKAIDATGYNVTGEVPSLSSSSLIKPEHCGPNGCK